MPNASDRRAPAPPAGLRYAALVTLLAFGCTTVRAPASAIGATVPIRDGVAEPQLELWLESGGAVSPTEATRASAQARAALEKALAARRVDWGDALLVVRAQGVSRTGSRRSDQRAAVAGIVVGAVVLVAVVALAVIAGSKDGGRGGGRASPGRAATAAPRVAGGVRGGGGGRVPARAPSVGPPVRSARLTARPAPGRPGGPAPVAAPAWPRRGSAPGVDVSVLANIQVWPEPESSDPAPAGVRQPIEAGPWLPPPPPPPDEFVEPAELAELAAVSLPPPQPLAVEQRGFFAEDKLRLELVLVDRRTGAPLQVKAVEGDVDARDARAVGLLLDRALADAWGWEAPPPEWLAR